MSDIKRTITPNRVSQIPLQPFRYWCQKVLPLVYDDSLSDYELLCKVVDYLNNTMEDVTNLLDAYNQLKDYVNNYFSSLDVQEEINNKLDQLVESGALPQILIKNKVTTFKTTEEFLNSDFVEGSTIKTLGFYNINDGGGAYFYITSESGGVNFEKNGLYARLLYSTQINIKQLGSKSGGDITNILTTLFENVNEGTEIIIEPLKYYTTNTININKRVTINGTINTNKNTEQITPDVFNIENKGNLLPVFNVLSSNVVIKNISIIGNSNYGIKISTIRNIIKNCYFYGLDVGIEFYKTGNAWIGENFVEHNIFSYCVIGVKSTRNNNGALMDSAFLYNIFARCKNSFMFDSTISMEFTGNHDYSENGCNLTNCRNTIISNNYFDCQTSTCITASLIGSLIIEANRFLVSGTEASNITMIKLTSESSSRLTVNDNALYYDGDYSGLFLNLDGSYIITTYLKNNIIYNFELVKSSFDNRNIHGNIKAGKINGGLGYTKNLCYLENDYCHYYLNCYGTINPGDTIGVAEVGGGILAETVSAVGKYVIGEQNYSVACTLYVQTDGTIQLSSDTPHVLNTLIANFSLKYAY